MSGENGSNFYHEVLTKLSEIAASQAEMRNDQQRLSREVEQLRDEQQELRNEQRESIKILRGDLVLITSKLHDENQNTKKKWHGSPHSSKSSTPKSHA